MIMRKVTQEAFYAAVGQLNVHPHILPGPYPYSSEWQMQDGSRRVIGKTVGVWVKPSVAGTDYYLTN